MIRILCLISTAIALMIGCSKQTEISTTSELITFSKYNISFKYPRDFSIEERKLDGTINAANDNFGIVQVNSKNN